MQFLRRVALTDRWVLVACFVTGFFIRLVPELLAFPVPIGFDTVYYAVVMKQGVVWPHWSSFFTSSWLLYAFIVPSYVFLQFDPFLLLKVVAPLLYGLNAAGIYFFARRMLGWDLRLGLFAVFLFSLQLASLRISWDLLRNTLGMGLLLFALACIEGVDSKRGFALFCVFSLLSVFAHEFAAVTLLVIVLGIVAKDLFRAHFSSKAKRLLMGVFPSLVVFVVGLFLRFVPVGYVVKSNVIGVGENLGVHPLGLFFLENHLAPNSSAFSYAGYLDLFLDVFLLFAVLFLPYFFLVVKGFFRHEVLDFWLILLVVGAFGCLFLPFSALLYWHRWMFMLVYPFTFYAVCGLKRLVNGFSNWRLRFGARVSRFSSAAAAGMVLLTCSLGAVYLFTPVLMVWTGAGLPLPSSLCRYFSNSPAVPYEDFDDVVAAMRWLEGNIAGASAVILQHHFLEYGRFYLGDDTPIIHVHSDLDLAVDFAVERGFGSVYFVFWNQPIGWFNVSIPEGFVRVQDFDRISVYVCEV